MVVFPLLPHAEIGRNDHREHASHFINLENLNGSYFLCYIIPSYSLPLNAISPSIFTLFRFLFAKTFINVLFPAPELPIMARTSPLRAHPETLSSMIFFDFSLDFTPKFDHFNTLLLNFNFNPYCDLV